MSRNLLHKTKLEAFKVWLDGHGVEHRPGRGDFQVLQVLVPRSGWQVVYDRIQAPEHYTVPKPLESLTLKFVRSKHAHN